MYITTQRDVIMNVSEAWDHTYASGMYGADKILTGDKLRALDLSKATAEEVSAIIGNDGWTKLSCNECGKPVDSVVTLGEEPDYESATAHICLSCLTDAFDKFARPAI